MSKHPLINLVALTKTQIMFSGSTFWGLLFLCDSAAPPGVSVKKVFHFEIGEVASCTVRATQTQEEGGWGGCDLVYRYSEAEKQSMNYKCSTVSSRKHPRQ